MFDNVFFGTILVLVFLSVLDCLTFSKKKNYFPAFVTTFILLLAFVITPSSVSLLIIAGLVGWLLYELGLFDNVAYVKLFVVCGLLLMGVKLFACFAWIVLGTIILDKIIRHKVFKFEDLSVPVIPHLLFSYLIVTFVGRLI